MFREGDVWICMEVMDTSIDKFYVKSFEQGKKIPEQVLGKIAFSVSAPLSTHGSGRQLIWVPILGDKRPALPSVTAPGDSPRCQAIEHSHLPRRQRQDVRFWNLGVPRGLCGEDNRRRLQALHGGESILDNP